MEDTNMLKIGTVISVPERKRNIYKIVGYTGNKYRITGCENIPGFPLKEGSRAGHYVVPFTHVGLTVIGKGNVETSFTPAYTPRSTKKVSDLDDIFTPPFVKEAFLSLENELSPENLCCDGEISHSQAMAKKAKIMKLWTALEGYIGQKVEPYL
jgi:hypothetical protein